jgi:tetratricopeptide (TPR) repeat protein
LIETKKRKVMQVKAWEEIIKIPTYKIGAPDKNPMFLEKRVYQGSSGVVYPHPVIDKVYDEKTDKEYTALYLENDYLKVMILPELGGRIQMAYDKTNGYDFIYHNKVIKPALVGLAGPWISGGIEFNWPQHHRPSTFEAIDYTIEENNDGSKTVWVNEYEIMFRTKCALGFTLHPDKAYIELHAKLYNRTPFSQTFLWWANPAVAVDEHYQSVFPPDVHAVFDHGKRDVSSFPIATGTYYKVDYAPGTDISRYTNIPVPTSYMAVNSEYNFVGGYHHQKKAGMLHIANHHVSPGKKQWTWGCGEFGKAWDRQLTDNDGPYFELMCGVFTDNQPDFSWIMPNEAREFKQYFMPYKEIGYVKNASIDAMVNLEIENGTADIKVYVTQKRKVTILFEGNGEKIFSEETNLSPNTTYANKVNLQSPLLLPQNYCISIFDDQNNLLISYVPVIKSTEAIPDPASPLLEPSAIATNEELYLAGLHLEQYRHATYAAEDYYLEAIRRDSFDIRCNNALGLLYLRRGQYEKSESYFKKAVEKINKHNPNPYDSEAFYNLGLCLQFQKRYKEATNAFFKSTWNTAMQDNAYLQLAYIECRYKNWEEALVLIDKSLVRNGVSLKAKHLKAIILRKQKKHDLAILCIQQSLLSDHFDFGSNYELYTILKENNNEKDAISVWNDLEKLMRNNNNNYIEIAIDYANAGCYNDAYNLLLNIASNNNSALFFYYLGHYAILLGNNVDAQKWFAQGYNCDPSKVFPNRLEDVEILKKAIEVNNKDYKAHYYLGNYFYAKKRYEDAKKSWESSVAICGTFATTHRNLGIAYFNKFNEKERALQSFEKAFECDATDSRVLFELDQLYKRFNKAPKERLHFLQKYSASVKERDDLYIEYILLHSITQQFKAAKQLLAARNFHPWEGGEGKTSGQHVYLHVELAKQAIENSNPEEALSLLHAATQYPENIGEGKLYGAQENNIHYWMGCAYEQMNDHAAAKQYWLKASVGLSEPSQAIFYNDQQPDNIFYQGMALLKLGNEEEANIRFNNLIRYGNANMNKNIKIDYFAVSLPDLSIFDDDLNIRNNIHCLYLIGLGSLGMKDYRNAQKSFEQAIGLDPTHVGSLTHSLLIDLNNKALKSQDKSTFIEVG